VSASADNLARAERLQSEAADPLVSAWVEASAGSGKTKLLTDRLLRLMLSGVAPGRILCLTFTKAAAAEMATRLGRALGELTTLPDGELKTRLHALCGRDARDDELALARTLFVRVLEQPGGMRIATIHAFAQSLLRSFPLEASLAPEFAVIEDADAAAMLAEARDAVLGEPMQGARRAILEDLARLVPPTRFAELVGTLARSRGKLAALLDDQLGVAALARALAARFGLDHDVSEESVLREGCDIDAAPLIAAASHLQASRNDNDKARGTAIRDWIALDIPARAVRWEEWRGLLLTKEGEPRKSYATQGCGASRQAVQDTLSAEAQRVIAEETRRCAAQLIAGTRALLAISLPVLQRYTLAKERAGALDFDDLIDNARRILSDPGSAWILYKLDGGLDHVLLDEAQDSNPGQWGIVRALTSEFFAGLGANDKPRSVFAVGDAKQAIYGFQGADSEGFRREKLFYERLARDAQLEFRERPLDVSFRSTAPVLSLVDAVFAEGTARAGVVPDGGTLVHYPRRAGHAGSVELWPLAQGLDADAPPPWAPPDAPVESAGAPQRLADALAARIAHMIAQERLPARVDRGQEDAQPEGRPIRPGDVLVLLRARHRGGFAASLVRALKERGVPVGGMDRMTLIEQIAVQDMLALADVLLLPEDDLALAALLKSPLVGLAEDELFDLAHARTGSLWAALAQHRAAESRLGRVANWLVRFMARADLLPPHTLFASVLGAEGPLDPRPGRARMLARLGPDAADPLDEFLNAALAHEARHPPSLQGFVHRLRQGGAEVKREAEGSGDVVRIMTAHAAKGLQAPVVILPDTTKLAEDRDTIRWLGGEDGQSLPLWIPRKGLAEPDVLQRLRAADRARNAEGENRLLYVALTRAQDRLIVCGWEGRRGLAPDCWYRLVEKGLDRLAGSGALTGRFEPAHFGADPDAFGPDPQMRHLICAQTVGDRERDPPPQAAASAVAVPAWAREKLAPEAVAAAAAPSAMAGEEETPAASPGGNADPLGRRFRRGRLVHALLQHLPDHPPERWQETAARFLARRGAQLTEAERQETLAEVLGLLAQPALAEALGPGSLAEAPLAGEIGGRMISGQVDRLRVTADRVLVIDYKTNRPPPGAADSVPPLYLRQMAAYRALLRAAFPGRAVACALVWTYGARFMDLPDSLLDAHAP